MRVGGEEMESGLSTVKWRSPLCYVTKEMKSYFIKADAGDAVALEVLFRF